MNPAWSYVLTSVGVIGLILAGRKRRTGWLVGLLAQAIWAAYAAATEQYGFIVSALVYGYVYADNYIRWRRDRPLDVAALREAAEMWAKVRPHVMDIAQARPVDVATTQKELALLMREQGALQHIVIPHQRNEPTS
jgi:hypothetical protein